MRLGVSDAHSDAATSGPAAVLSAATHNPLFLRWGLRSPEFEALPSRYCATAEGWRALLLLEETCEAAVQTLLPTRSTPQPSTVRPLPLSTRSRLFTDTPTRHAPAHSPRPTDKLLRLQDDEPPRPANFSLVRLRLRWLQRNIDSTPPVPSAGCGGLGDSRLGERRGSHAVPGPLA